MYTGEVINKTAYFSVSPLDELFHQLSNKTNLYVDNLINENTLIELCGIEASPAIAFIGFFPPKRHPTVGSLSSELCLCISPKF